jgi:hypothetical protein
MTTEAPWLVLLTKLNNILGRAQSAADGRTYSKAPQFRQHLLVACHQLAPSRLQPVVPPEPASRTEHPRRPPIALCSSAAHIHRAPAPRISPALPPREQDTHSDERSEQDSPVVRSRIDARVPPP